MLSRVFADGLVALPRRLGLVPMRPDLKSLVLVSSNARIGRPKRPVPGLDEVIKADQLKTRLFDEYDRAPAYRVGRVIGKEGLERFARELAALHRPRQVDWAARFGLPASTVPAMQTTSAVAAASDPPPGRRGSGHRCASCGSPVSFAVVKFCWSNKQRFGGEIYCMADQARF